MIEDIGKFVSFNIFYSILSFNFIFYHGDLIVDFEIFDEVYINYKEWDNISLALGSNEGQKERQENRKNI